MHANTLRLASSYIELHDAPQLDPGLPSARPGTAEHLLLQSHVGNQLRVLESATILGVCALAGSISNNQDRQLYEVFYSRRPGISRAAGGCARHWEQT